MAESPGSPLSSLASEEFVEDLRFEDRAQSPSSTHLPPSKRRKTGPTAWDRHTPISSTHEEIGPTSPSSSISSDSSAELPPSPGLLSLIGSGIDEDYSGVGRDQVTDCPRKGQTHASGYALRAHMRSHTKEKPFYCSLPECDRSFTRSDALSKHMRTVHETEALKPFDALGKHSAQSGSAGINLLKLPRIKLKLSHSSRDGILESGKEDKADAPQRNEQAQSPPADTGLEFDAHELSLPLSQLHRLLRRQIYWAEQESRHLESEWRTIIIKRRKAWREKESILEDVIHAEVKLFRSTLTAEDLALGQSIIQPIAP
ncbi:predicted protein [Uncinocarpus reesii 1704]|uniref:C2H2-type domain-containing protein n=1 Tax=Uncinocarpus reesii (strain UAMH 1704) TaxID=336963 RepID=C4JQU4_UNCRE|nr:uncharacterized protein UREG_03426 [Uncinocarpus reesii 1704]EEP78580.1 predicted protein [Uncinocarpus reesii 1704]